ncbi:DUF881 domain-containing protein [Bifidobacterium platyrrhinorum]|uniref:DUF881 domain-containing protein n=1 Tax=Bifidobacterium platyrrhinorum TaxID=2661628 RepID=A0A6L9SSC5_9BIFI|nr:DUF881 domain-containing protein [Bifidobacterium platyrrhinorum]NEG54693.1 DUF881 domain-containing protein [Bifidobacterium platyrrhinorum]
MTHGDPAPASYPVEAAQNAERRSVRRRSAFSHAYRGLISHHAARTTISAAERERRKRVRQDDSLRLIDDLTNRPLDPIYLDANLGAHKESPVAMWATRVVCFVVCIGVGFLGSLFVQQLHSDPRKEVRASLASELESSQTEVNRLTGEVGALRRQIDRQSKRLNITGSTQTVRNDEMASGQVKVEGEGIVLSVANPLAAANDSSTGATPRETAGNHLRVVTDGDLQQLVSLLWRAGAEAIAVNGYRLGSQTSIRTAGGTILIGLDAVESPYRIEAIGDRRTLAKVIDQDNLGSLYDAYKDAGITLQVKQYKTITLEAAVVGDVSYARKVK